MDIIKKITNGIRTICSHEEVRKNIELTSIILDLQNDIADLIQEKTELAQKVHDLTLLDKRYNTLLSN